MEKIVMIDGKEVGFKATALTPRLYRHRIGRDMIQDLNRLRKAYKKVQKGMEEDYGESQLDVIDLEIFEDTAYIMACQYDPSVPDTPEEWLENFTTFSIYEILPEILELWAINNKTTATPKKN